MKITFDFGRKAQHTVRARNEALEMAVEELSRALANERKSHAVTRDLLAEALKARVAGGHRFKALQQGQQAVRIVNGGPARFQLEEGKL